MFLQPVTCCKKLRNFIVFFKCLRNFYNYGTLDEKGQIDDAGNTEVVELGGLYDEWGWEFAAEARRRTDMIRFGTYQKKSWFNHTPTANDLNGNSILFPIHLDHLNTNPNLQQNPGYAGK